jgi:ABC-2 type transport system ATP-binding protein
VHALAIDDLVKTYGSKRAVDGVGLEIEPGELVGLLGPNGAGKSTLVKVVCGLVRADSGTVRVCGEEPRTPKARGAIGYLAELFRYQPWLSADEVMSFHQRLARSEGGAKERTELLELVAMAGVSGRRVGHMSKGMQQRLGLAQALIGSPRLLLLDEPTSALDPAGRHAVRAILQQVKDRGVSVLLNSHLLTEVELVCDRVVMIQHGRVVAEGTPEDLTAGGGVEIETDSGVRRWPEAVRDEIPALVAGLVAEGRRVYAVRQLRNTLEEVYLRVVEGEIS